MTNLKPITFGLNEYCGPSVLSALTGKTTDECAGIISSITGKNIIKGVQLDDLIKALDRLRFDSVKMKVPAFSLFGTLSALSDKPGMYVIGVPRHVVAVEVVDNKIYLIDNHTKEAIKAEASARLHQQVDVVYKVQSRGELIKLSERITVEKIGNYLYIQRITEYNDSKENSKARLGNLYFKDEDELKAIVKSLGEWK